MSLSYHQPVLHRASVLSWEPVVHSVPGISHCLSQRLTLISLMTEDPPHIWSDLCQMHITHCMWLLMSLCNLRRYISVLYIYMYSVYTVIWEIFIVKIFSWFKSTTKIKCTKFLLQCTCIFNAMKIYCSVLSLCAATHLEDWDVDHELF